MLEPEDLLSMTLVSALRFEIQFVEVMETPTRTCVDCAVPKLRLLTEDLVRSRAVSLMLHPIKDLVAQQHSERLLYLNSMKHSGPAGRNHLTPQ